MKINKQKSLFFIQCECGATFLILPDVKEMSIVIDAHAKKHCLGEINPERAAAQKERIQTLLIKQLFEKIGNLDI